MSLNKECYMKSLKKDFSEIGYYCLFVVAVIICGCIGYLYREFIMGIATLIVDMIPSSVIITLVGFISLIVFEIVVCAGLSQSGAKEESVITLILGMYCLVIMMYIVMGMAYAMYVASNGISSLEISNCTNEVLIGFIIISIMNVIISPFTIGYVRCKGE
jgi:hypothetical protein